MAAKAPHRRLAGALAILAALAACDGPHAGTPAERLPAAVENLPLPPMRRFPAGPGTPAHRSNGEMVQDFLDLSFRLETGRPLAAFSRFDGPMAVQITGDAPATARTDLAELLARLRSEAGLPITMAAAGERPTITIEFMPRRKLQAQARDAACFAAPRVSSWADYRRAGAARLDWTDYVHRTEAAIFIPSDTGPQEARDCCAHSGRATARPAGAPPPRTRWRWHRAGRTDAPALPG